MYWAMVTSPPAMIRALWAYDALTPPPALMKAWPSPDMKIPPRTITSPPASIRASSTIASTMTLPGAATWKPQRTVPLIRTEPCFTRMLPVA